MNLNEFNPDLDAARLEDCEVVGLEGDVVIHFNADDGSVYEAGLNLEDWLNGHGEGWCLTETEAGRVGIADYGAYVARLQILNPQLVDEASVTGCAP